jgi:hypothetical protein
MASQTREFAVAQKGFERQAAFEQTSLAVKTSRRSPALPPGPSDF